MIKNQYIDNKNIVIGAKNKYNKLFVTLFIFIQIHLTFEAAPKGLRWSKELVVFSSFFFISVVFFFFVFSKKINKINVSSIIFTTSIVISSLLAIIINKDFQPDNFIFLSIVISGFFVCNIFNRNDFLEGYVNAIIIYSVYSIFATYILLPLAVSGTLTFFPTSTNFLGVPFVDMGFSFAVKWYGIMRNQGIFREPGVYQFFILVALYIEMFYVKTRSINYLYILILIITLITTFSTAGLLCVIPIIVIFLFQLRTKKFFKFFLVFSFVFLVIFIFVMQNNDISNLFHRSFYKLGNNTESESFIVRFESIFNLLKMSIHNPIFGSSFVNGFSYIQNNFNNKLGITDITGTMLSYIMALGFPIGLWINLNFYKFCKVINKKSSISFLIYLSLFLSINTQNLVYNTVIWSFIFIPYMKEKNIAEVD